MLAVVFSLGGQMLVIYSPPLQYVFQTEPLSAYDIFELLIVSSSVFVFSEIKKYFDRTASMVVGKVSNNMKNVSDFCDYV